MPWVIGGAIAGSAVLNYLSSQDAADAQSGAANNANALQYQMFLQNQANYAPWLKAGGQSLDKLMWGSGVGSRDDYRNAFVSKFTTPGTAGAPTTLTGTLISGTDGSGSWVDTDGDGSGDTWQTVGGTAVFQYPDGTTGSTPTKTVAGAPGAATFDKEGFQSAWKDFRGDGGFGYIQEDMPGSDKPFKPDPFKFKKDPGYNFRLSEGLKAVEGSAAAKGMLHSGRTLKELNRYGQGFASNELGNAFNRYAWEQGFNSNEYTNAFNRYMSNRGVDFNQLATLAGFGQTATGQVAGINQNYAGNVGNNYIGAGNAAASGYMGGANAINSGVNAGINAYYQNQFLNRMPPGGSGYTWPYGP